jgi:hypothetical protein
MPNILKEVAILRQEGKLHTRLITRVRMLFVIAFILLALVAFNVYQGANILIALALAIVGFVMGFYVFSRMSRVEWNEEEEVVEASKMDRFGYGLIGLYIVFEIGARTLLADYFGAGAEAFVFALIFGIIFGRATGMVFEIHRVFKTTHKEA